MDECEGKKGDLWPHLVDKCIIHIILELRSQISKSATDMDIMRIIAAASKKCGLFWSRSDFTTK